MCNSQRKSADFAVPSFSLPSFSRVQASAHSFPLCRLRENRFCASSASFVEVLTSGEGGKISVQDERHGQENSKNMYVALQIRGLSY
jgi:hypothetical protein